MLKAGGSSANTKQSARVIQIYLTGFKMAQKMSHFEAG
jgi:hypothetical protein